jgi:hypothetical protein
MSFFKRYREQRQKEKEQRQKEKERLEKLRTSPNANLHSTVKKSEWYLGDELTGKVHLRSQEEFDVESIFVQINCVETVTKVRRYQTTEQVGEDDEGYAIEEAVWQEEEYEDDKNLYRDQVQVSGLLHVNAGFDKEFLFVIKLPSIGRATYRSVDHTVEWLIGSYMRVRNRKTIVEDNGSILVGKPSISVKEVVKEVVLIPCAYCKGLMPQTSVFCPNCGARRKG